MKYKVIADASIENDRVCVYMKFDPTGAVPLLFAGQKQVSQKITSIKDVSFTEVLAWLGFNHLSSALYTSPVFSKRYKTEIHQIYEGQLVVNVINEVPHFFYNVENEWKTTEDIGDLIGYFSESLKTDIEHVMGSAFMAKYKAILHEKMTCSLLEAEYEQQKQELIDEHNSKKETAA